MLGGGKRGADCLEFLGSVFVNSSGEGGKGREALRRLRFSGYVWKQGGVRGLGSELLIMGFK